MAHSDFSISITDKAVDVGYTPSVSDPRGKLYGFIFIISTIVVLACAVLFLPGKHGNPSMWHDLASAPAGSSGFLTPVIGLTLFTGLFGWQGFRYARAAWASGLEAPEAKTILTGLKALGADVPDDPKLDKRIKQTLEMRFGDTSWMDRSWMDPNKQ